MVKVKFSAEIEVPDGAPLEDVEAWLRFELGATGQLLAGNAMNHTDLLSVGCKNVDVRTW